MREIGFRGKRLDNGEWVYGDLIRTRCYTHDGKKMYEEESVAIVSDTTFVEYDGQPYHKIFCFVDPATVGQYTELKDRNNMKIYEGDIFKTSNSYRLPSLIEWDKENARYLGRDIKGNISYIGREPAIEVCGNIHDNPELLSN